MGIHQLKTADFTAMLVAESNRMTIDLAAQLEASGLEVDDDAPLTMRLEGQEDLFARNKMRLVISLPVRRKP